MLKDAFVSPLVLKFRVGGWKVLETMRRNAQIFSFFFQYLFLFSFAETQKWRSDVRSPAVAVSHLVKSVEAEKISHNWLHLQIWGLQICFVHLQGKKEK